ncbi:PLP-dependent lyase/thiolase [Candidatus Uhrbacteria bacterium]|nr:PLP-dependent lyase/thiolase [Candidatus Uhrbacteria bacterium]
MHERGEVPRSNETTVVKRVEYPRVMSRDLVEQWGDGIPAFSEANPKDPEWRATPLYHLDLTTDGYGEVWVKDESDRTSNPTGTIKDRAAWELATLYRDYARALYLRLRIGSVTERDLAAMPIPRFSMITSGNEGRAVAERFAQHDLPPPKIIVATTMEPRMLAALKKLRADIYTTDLTERALTAEELQRLSENEGGVDITAVRSIEPNAIFYDWHVHETLNEEPNAVYVPYGSGRLMENYVTWQERTIRNDAAHMRDPRLRANVGHVIAANIIGAEPKRADSIANKLTARFKPFLLFQDTDISAMRNLRFTGSRTGKVLVSEERIREAHEFFTRHGIAAEPSGAAGLALYLEQHASGAVQRGSKIIVVNTGRGLEVDASADAP